MYLLVFSDMAFSSNISELCMLKGKIVTTVNIGERGEGVKEQLAYQLFKFVVSTHSLSGVY